MALSQERMEAWLKSDLSKLDLLVIQFDGLHVAEDIVLVVAIGIDANGPMVGAFGAAGAATGAFMDDWLGSPANDNVRVHANSNNYYGNVEVYHLYDRDSSELVKIGTSTETSTRYTQAQLAGMNARHEVVQRYTWRYAAYLHEFVELQAYKSANGQYPKYNINGR